MKKILFLLLGVFAYVGVNAQSGNLKSSPTHAIYDTVTNAGSKTQLIQIQGYQAVVSIQTTVVEISGTTGGRIVLLGSLDGETYDTVRTTAQAEYASWVPTDITTAQTYIWPIGESNYQYYAVRYTGTGTMSARFKSFAIWRK